MNDNRITLMLQNYNRRHFKQYYGQVVRVSSDDGSGYLMFDNQPIPGTAFECYEDLEYILNNQ